MPPKTLLPVSGTAAALDAWCQQVTRLLHVTAQAWGVAGVASPALTVPVASAGRVSPRPPATVRTVGCRANLRSSLSHREHVR